MAIKANWQKTTFFVGDTVKIDYKIAEEGKKERIQPFQGIVIGIKGRGESKTFTLRKIAVDNIAVERTFPLCSPWITNLQVIRKPNKKIKRAKLYYLRRESGKKRQKKL